MIIRIMIDETSFDSGGNKDYLIVGTDSGRISIMEYVPTKNTFEKVRKLSTKVVLSATLFPRKTIIHRANSIPADSSRNLREVRMS